MQLPYLIVAAVLVVLAVVIARFPLPDMGAQTRRVRAQERATHSLWRHRNLVFGVPAIFIYLIAEIGVANLFINFVSQPNIANLTHEQASHYLFLLWGGMMVGRFAGSFDHAAHPGERVLAWFAVGAPRRHAGDLLRARAARDVGADPRRPVPLDHVSDDLHAGHPRPGAADRGGLRVC